MTKHNIVLRQFCKHKLCCFRKDNYYTWSVPEDCYTSMKLNKNYLCVNDKK